MPRSHMTYLQLHPELKLLCALLYFIFFKGSKTTVLEMSSRTITKYGQDEVVEDEDSNNKTIDGQIDADKKT